MRVENCQIQMPIGGTVRVPGFTTPSGKYAVAASARWGVGDWKLSSNPRAQQTGTEVRLLARIDMSVSECVDGQVGDTIIPYIGGRVLQTRGRNGITTPVIPGFENDSTRALKSILSNADIFAAAKEAAAFALQELEVATKEGRPAVTRTSEYLSNAGQFCNLADQQYKPRQQGQQSQDSSGSIHGTSRIQEAIGSSEGEDSDTE